MWREVAELAFPEARFSAPVEPAGVAAAERRLGSSLPAGLVSLLQETDGIVGHYGTDTSGSTRTTAAAGSPGI